MLGGVFISYRREDSGGFAGRIYDRLTNRLGRESVFFDVDNIPPGLDFVEVLSDRVGKCDALIAVIGKQWVASADTQNRRRLDDPNDFVRIEIEAALQRNVPVIPVLVDGAAMPQAGELPDSLKKLTRRQAVEISHARFDSDAERLTDALSQIEEKLRGREAGAPPAAQDRAFKPARTPASSAGASVSPASAMPPTAAPPASAFPKPAKSGGRGTRVLVAILGLLVAGAAAALLVLGRKPSDEWLTRDEFQAEFNKKAAAGLYPDASSSRCDDGVLKTSAHWTARPPAMRFFHFNMSEDAFASKNAELTGQGFALRYDNTFKDCDGQTRHLALWTKSG